MGRARSLAPAILKNVIARNALSTRPAPPCTCFRIHHPFANVDLARVILEWPMAIGRSCPMVGSLLEALVAAFISAMSVGRRAE